MSRATFIRRFQAATGMTFGQFVTRARLMTAADLLAGSDLGVAAVAAEVGYRSESAFTRAFRSETGQTPARFRRAHQDSLVPAMRRPAAGRGRSGQPRPAHGS